MTAPLFVPVESQVRELDAKLLFACSAAERGFDVILGSRAFLSFAVPFLPRGIYVAKSLRFTSARMLGALRDLGHEVVAWDEESLVRFSAPDYYAWRFCPKAFRTVSRLFAWGEDDAELFRTYPDYHGVPLHVTGNPRVDLLRPELRGYFAREADALRLRFGRFLLVNTNFSFVNAFVRSLNLLQRRGGGFEISRTGRGMSAEFARGMFEHQRAIFEAFRVLVPALRRWFPQLAIVIRPHPSEDHEVWRRAVAGQENVHVLHEGNVVPWLIACEVLLHNGCTTAVEAAVLGTPAVAYQPVTSAAHDFHLPNALSHRAYTSQECRELLAEVHAGRLGPVTEAERRRLFARHLAAVEGMLAADRIVTALENAARGERAPVSPAPWRRARAWVATNVRTAVKLVNMRRSGHRNSAAYHAHRFPGVTVAELQARIERLRALLGRFEQVEVGPAGRHLFRVAIPHRYRQAMRSRDGLGAAPV